MTKLLQEILAIFNFIGNILPGRLGVHYRRILYGLSFQSLGKNLFSDVYIYIACAKKIIIGNNCRINRFCSLVACESSLIQIGDNVSINEMVNINAANGGKITIGNNVLIGSNVIIRAADHNIRDTTKDINKSGHIAGTINIENNVWIASNCVITKNVTIEEGSVIGAGTVITKDVKKNSIITNNNNNLQIRSR